jgi:hypothetical protein
MSAFNVLNAEIICTSCGEKYLGRIQFKYGDTWQLEYFIGDRLKWGGNDIGIPGVTKVKVYGILETESGTCSKCGSPNSQDEYDIFVEKDVIIALSALEEIKDYFENEGNYKILVK